MFDHARPFPNSPVVAIDIETTGLDFHTDEILLISLSDGVDDIVIQIHQSDHQEIGKWLAAEVYDRLILVHNATFDLPWLDFKTDCGFPSHVWDTETCEQILTAGLPRDGESYKKGDKQERIPLKHIAKKYLDVDLNKEIREEFIGHQGGEFTPEQLEYATLDTRILPHIAKLQWEQVKRLGLKTIWRIEQQVTPIYCEMRRDGYLIDEKRLEPLIQEYQRELELVKFELEAILTFYVKEMRIAKFNAMTAKMDEYKRREEEARYWFEDEWRSLLPDFEVDEIDGVPVYMFPREWLDKKWNRLDEGTNGKPKGLNAYVKSQMKIWHEENTRPQKPPLDDDAPINLSAPAQLKYALTSMLGFTVENTQADTLERLLTEVENPEHQHVLARILDYRDRVGFVTRYAVKFNENRCEGHNCRGRRLHPEFVPTGTTSGRPTSYGDFPILQTPHDPKIRQLFIPEEGNAFLPCDYSQFELRGLAEISQDPRLIQVFVNGDDVHAASAAMSYRIPIDEVNKDQRDVGKTTNYLIGYGGGENKLMESQAKKGNFMTKRDAKGIIENWREGFSVGWNYLLRQQNLAVSQGFTETPLGRKRFFVKPEDGYLGGIQRAGANHVLQGMNADVTKIAMYAAHQALKPLDGKIRLNVYDELVAEVPIANARQAVEIMKEVMVQSAKVVLRTVPVEVDCHICYSWSEKDTIPDEVLDEYERRGDPGYSLVGGYTTGIGSNPDSVSLA